MMPVMDGISALKEIRSKKIDIPVLILTAKSEIDDKVYGLDSGANDYLTKPFATKELLARLRVLTRKSNSDLGNEIVFSNMHLVWVYISNLRKKLASVNAKVKIKVSRNLGYYLEKTDD